MAENYNISSNITSFCENLRHQGFQGDIGNLYADRLIAATDNSIYQQMPQLVVFPRHADDINFIVQAAQKTQTPIAPRGGGTGTNAQSLTEGVVVDVSRYMDQIIDLDQSNMTVRVQPGVILSRLNAFLKPYGFFFPPMVSTATRATIGGMIATDASGKGSRLYGKTSDHILSLDVVLSDGSSFTAQELTEEETNQLINGNSRASIACREIYRVVNDNVQEIKRIFPKMNRGLTGYNLQNIISSTRHFNPIKILSGSEGTLAFTKEVVLKIKKIPKYKHLLVIRYNSFDAALDHIDILLKTNPLAIEILDDHVLKSARDDSSWEKIKSILGGETDQPVKGINFVEFVGDNLKEINENIEKAQKLSQCSGVLDHQNVSDSSLIAQLWGLRTTAVGLLGRPRGDKQGIPFIEDTAVPPKNLPFYTKEFRHILDKYNLEYGMFGHADVGCLHVRPFLNMRDPSEQKYIRSITEEVAHLTHRYDGLLWGEHGRGVRGEFSPLFFGEKLFSELCQIKLAFDSKDLFNRGKLVPVENYKVYKIDEIPFRGFFDSQIKSKQQKKYAAAINCNGNGACFNQEPETIMCPSYKATKDRLQSPKGRAALLREWLRLSSNSHKNRKNYRSLIRSVKKSLETCLACKACSSQCPIHVDIPSLRSHFLNEYYKFRVRPLRDYLILNLEFFLKIGRLLPKTTNFLMHNILSRKILSWIGLVDLPNFSVAHLPIDSKITQQWISNWNPKKVVLLQDSFIGSFEGNLVEDAYYLLRNMGFDVRITPVFSNGKACYIKGFKKSFSYTCKTILNKLNPISKNNIPIVFLDAASGLMFDHEYCEDKNNPKINVLSYEKFIFNNLSDIKISSYHKNKEKEFYFISHCSSQSLSPNNSNMWKDILNLFNINIINKKIGCCGMAGLFGHEKSNSHLSKKIFNDNWKPYLNNNSLIEGFSCRCQISRMTGKKPLHPLQLLKEYTDH